LKYNLTYITFTYLCDWYFMTIKSIEKRGLFFLKLIINATKKGIKLQHLVLSKSNRDDVIIFSIWNILILAEIKNGFDSFIEILPNQSLLDLLARFQLLVKCRNLCLTVPLIAPYGLKLLLLFFVYHIIIPPNTIIT
jgi:hypothetical protein